MRFELFVALRYLFARRKQAFIYIISAMSVLGVAIQSFYDEDTYLFTTILDGEVVGTCSVDISGANNLIFGLCVIPSHQHQGIGSQMLKNIINDILKTNEKPITICVESENKTALRLYTSSGFNIISQYEYYQTKI